MSLPPPEWPHRAASRAIRLGTTDWHVQVTGTGPDVLLLHGTGASGHSWRALVPLLAPGHRLIVPDLPGHGFSRTGSRGRLGIDGMAGDLAALMADQGWEPDAIIGHSSGGALALRLAEVLPRAPAALVGINAALGSFEGLAGWLFPKLARALAMSPMIAHVVARVSTSRARVEKLIASTGSRLGAEGVDLYRELLARPEHIDGTLAMMAAWDLGPLMARLGQVAPPVLLVAAAGDLTVPPAVTRRAAALIPRVEVAEVPRLGHLVHEEAAALVASLILPFLARHLVTQPAA
jgi:magnesium chelatase accessory protein